MAELVQTYIDTHIEINFSDGIYHGGTASSGVIKYQQTATQDTKEDIFYLINIIDTGQTLKICEISIAKRSSFC